MYIPKANEEKRISVMHELISAQPFGCLVTLGEAGLIASHIPMVLEHDGSMFGTLRAHISRANKQWSDLTPSVDALAIFSGDHHYISPSWYTGTKVHGKEVPTWNYVVVHAYGPLKTIEDRHWLLAHVEKLAEIHETGFATPWKVSYAPAEYIEQQLNGIIGLEMPIRRLEGKWKLSQNKSERDRQTISEELSKRNTPESLSMSKLLETAREKT